MNRNTTYQLSGSRFMSIVIVHDLEVHQCCKNALRHLGILQYCPLRDLMLASQMMLLFAQKQNLPAVCLYEQKQNIPAFRLTLYEHHHSTQQILKYINGGKNVLQYLGLLPYCPLRDLLLAFQMTALVTYLSALSYVV